jgi:hypothetical protein
MTWIFSGVGVTVASFLLNRLRHSPKKNRRPVSLARAVHRVVSTSLATEQATAFNAMAGLQTEFQGRVVGARAMAEAISVDFSVRPDIRVSCLFPRNEFPEMSLTKIGEKLRVIGKVVCASPEVIEISPSSPEP